MPRIFLLGPAAVNRNRVGRGQRDLEWLLTVAAAAYLVLPILEISQRIKPAKDSRAFHFARTVVMSRGLLFACLGIFGCGHAAKDDLAKDISPPEGFIGSAPLLSVAAPSSQESPITPLQGIAKSILKTGWNLRMR